MSIDDAFATPLTLVGSCTPAGTVHPMAAVVVRFPGHARIREMVLQALLGRGWKLVLPPLQALADDLSVSGSVTVALGDKHVTVTDGGEILYDGALPLHADITGDAWRALARTGPIRSFGGLVAVFVTVGPTPVLNDSDLRTEAEAGRLVGVLARASGA